MFWGSTKRFLLAAFDMLLLSTPTIPNNSTTIADSRNKQAVSEVE
jgi:hypothetical protein